MTSKGQQMREQLTLLLFALLLLLDLIFQILNLMDIEE